MWTHSRYKNREAVPLAVEADTPEAHVIAEKIPDGDDASKAFQGQIDALRKAEQHVAETAKQPQHGLKARQQAFLDANPEMLDEPDRLGRSILQAHTQGFEPDSHEFHAAVAANFRNHHLAVAAANRATLDGHQAGTPEHQQATDANLDDFIGRVNDSPRFASEAGAAGWPTPSALRHSQEDKDLRMRAAMGGLAGLTDCRSVPDGRSYNERGGRVVMTPAMKDAARISGISEVEYAEQVLRLREAKKNGDYHGGQP
jgi:hypothetical protein